MSKPQHQLNVWLFLFAFCAYAHEVSAQIPLDTSYTIANTYQKLVKQYPDIKIAEVGYARDVKEILDVVYLSIPETPYGKRDLHADIFIPREENESFPAIIMVHGGGWRSGNKSLNIPMATALAMRGFVVVSIEYRLSLEAKYPAAIHDVVTAIRWTRAHSNQYQIDPTHVAIAGYSAGGQLASLVGVTNGNKKFENKLDDAKFSREVQAVINLDGLVDFTNPESLAVKRNENSADVFWFGGTYEEIPDRWNEASPLHWVHHNSPPFLFVNSSQTRFHAGCADMMSRLNEYGIYSEVHKLGNAPHSYWFFHPWFKPTIEYMTNFLNKVFHLK
jgi:acetyl esterase/lipase